MLTQWVVMVLNCNVLCHLQQCKCPDQDLWAPLYVFVFHACHTKTYIILAATSQAACDVPIRRFRLQSACHIATAAPPALINSVELSGSGPLMSGHPNHSRGWRRISHSSAWI